MEDKILIAIIAAASALLGSFIPSIFAFYNGKSQRKFDLIKIQREKQSDSYKNMLLTLQDFGNNPENANVNFYKLQNTVLEVVIYGDKLASEATNKYYQELVASTQNLRQPLNNEEHREHHANILNSMRKSLGLESISNFQLIRFTPPKA